MIDGEISELLLAGYVPLRSNGFALPCYASGPQSNAWYCAVCSIDGDHTGTVIGFETFESDDIVRLRSAAARTVAVGDPWHDVLLWKGEQHVGTPPIIAAQLGESVAELAADAPLSLLELAMASDELDRGALAATAYAHVEAHWGTDEAVRWQADGFLRHYLILESRRLLVAAGVVDTSAAREIDVERDGDSLRPFVPPKLRELFLKHDIHAQFVDRASALARDTNIPLLPPAHDEISDISRDAPPPEKVPEPETAGSEPDRGAPQQDYEPTAAVLVLASGSRARLVLRHVRPPDWEPRWHDEPRSRRRRRSSSMSRDQFVKIDAVEDRDGIPNLDSYGVIIWLVDEEAYVNDHGRVISAQLQAALSHGATPLCIIAPMLPAQRPPAILADRSLSNDMQLFDIILDTAVVRSPFWPGNSRRSIDRRVADLISATAQLAAPGSPLHGWLTEDRPRYEPLLLSITSGARLGKETFALASEVSSSGLAPEKKQYREPEEFTWSEKPLGDKRTPVLEGAAIVRRHDPVFQPFAEVVARHQVPHFLERDHIILGEVPSSISEGLQFPHLAAVFRAEQKRSDAICVMTAEAPSLKALRGAAKIGWSVLRYSDDEGLRSLASNRRLKSPVLPADIALPELNRLGRNRGLAIRGVDPRDVIRLPAEVLEKWRQRFGKSDLAASFRWYRSDIRKHDEPSQGARIAALPVELFLEAEQHDDAAARFLRDHEAVATATAGALAKRTADLRASWSEPAEGASRFMFEDGKLPVRFGPLDHEEVAAQKFFTIDGDASVPLLFSSRLFHVWARATLTRSPSWSSRFSITRTFETFPLPDQFIVMSDGEAGRASLRADPRSKGLAELAEDYEAELLGIARRGFPPDRSSYAASDRIDYLEEVDARLLDMIGLPPDVADLDLLERLVEMNRHAGRDDRPWRDRRFGRTSSRSGQEFATWNVVVEGPNDEIGLRRIIQRLSPTRSSDIRIWAAGGAGNVPGILRNLVDAGHENLAVLLDADDASRRLIDEARTLITARGGHLVLVHPNMENWLESCCPSDYVLGVPATSVRAKAIRRFSGHASLDEVLRSNADFAVWAADALGITIDEASTR